MKKQFKKIFFITRFIKKKKALILPTIIIALIICLTAVIVCVVSAENNDSEEIVAKVGKYTISEKDMRIYLILSQSEYGKNNSPKNAAREYTMTRIAEEEIAGTSYDVDSTSKESILKEMQEKEPVSSDVAYCKRVGISLEELNEAAATAKWDIIIRTNHIAMFTSNYLDDLDENARKGITPEQIIEQYDKYMSDKLEEYEYIVLNNNKLYSLEKFSLKLEE